MVAKGNGKKLITSLVKIGLRITIAGIIIGYFHEHDIWLAVFLFLKMIHSYFTKIKNDPARGIMIRGMLLTGLIGVFLEIIAVIFNQWEYHDIPFKLPFWLLFAWMLSFRILYEAEKSIFPLLDQNKPYAFLITAGLLSMVFPTFGEMITIALGVWTYHIPFQLFGVPYIVMIGLMLIHMTVNTFFVQYCKKHQIKDVVFNP